MGLAEALILWTSDVIERSRFVLKARPTSLKNAKHRSLPLPHL
jgi:hypothetical protein